MKKIILSLVFVFSMGTMVNANSSVIVNESNQYEAIPGCARDCVDLATTIAYLLDHSIKEYQVVYEACVNQNCKEQ